ncbi:MAG: potassium channel family protein [bacterium]
MRIIVIGAGEVGISVSRQLIEWKDEVILIEKDPDIADRLADELDCTVINGDGSDPEILKNAQIDQADTLIALTESDQSNIIIALMAKTFGETKTIVRISKPSFIPISRNLGIDTIVAPTMTTSVQATYLSRGLNLLELVNLVRGEARFYHLSAGPGLHGKKVGDLGIPSDAILFAIYRKKEFLVPKADAVIHKDDELVFILKKAVLDELKAAFQGEE